MGIREDVLALADDVESTIGGCYGCLLDKRGLCKAESDFDCNDEVCKFVAHRLRAIAEHDADGVTTVSAYDLLPEDEREAIAWVRAYGGLDLVKAFVRQAEMEHGYLLKIAHALGTSIYDGSDNADALLEKLEKRLMPEGYEWPRYESGEPLRYKDRYIQDGDESEVWHVDFDSYGDVTILNSDYSKCSLDKGERVKRPSKVLDADGVEIRVGDKLYDTDTGCGRTVRAINAIGTVEFEGYEDRGWFTRFLTHRAPVFAADVRPLHEGEHVYHVETGAELVVKELPKPGEYQAVVVFAPPASHPTSFDPNLLTHERPVLDADGVEIKQGDTVYVLGFGEPHQGRGDGCRVRARQDARRDGGHAAVGERQARPRGGGRQ